MPYHLMKYPKGYKVMDDKGFEYSKKPLSKQRAISQMRALYAKDTYKGKGYTSYHWNGNHHLVLHGRGRFTEFIKKGVRKVGELAKKAIAPALRAFNVATTSVLRDDLPPAARATLNQYGNCIIKSIMVRREPIKQWIHTALDYISLGQWNNVRRRLNYDKLYHLSLVAGIQCADGTKKGIMMEKNEVINITDKYDDGSSRAGAGTEMEYFNVPVPTPIPLKQFVDNAIREVGPSIYQYDAFSNNCQVFIVSLLRANNLLSQQMQSWILQPTESLLVELPDFVAPAARSITNIAALADRVIEGRGGEVNLQLEGKGYFKDTARTIKHNWETQLKAYLRLQYPTDRSKREREFKYKDKIAGEYLNVVIQKMEEYSDFPPLKRRLLDELEDELEKIKRYPVGEIPKNTVDAITEEVIVPGEGVTELHKEFADTGRLYKVNTLKDARKAQLEAYREHGALREDVDEAGNIVFRMANPPPVERNPFTRVPVRKTDKRHMLADIDEKSKVSDVMKMVGHGFFDDIGSWFKTTFTGQRDEYPLQPLYDVIEMIGPAPTASDYGFNELEMSRTQTVQSLQALQTGDYRKIEDAVFDRRRDTQNRLKREGLKGFALDKELQRLSHTDPYYRDWKTKEEYCFYETMSAKASGIGNAAGRAPPPKWECEGYDTVKPKEGESYDTARQATNLCAWLKTPAGLQFKQAVAQWNANKKEVEKANLEIIKNNELIEAENAKIRDCNESFGCALKTAFTNITDVVSWIPGPIGTVAGLANTGLSFIGDGKPKGGRRLPPMPDLTIEQFEGMYGKPLARSQYPPGPEGDAKYNEAMKRHLELYEARKKGISPANPTTADFVSRGQKIVAEQDRQRAAYIAEQQRKAKSFPDIVLPQCDPAPDRTEEYRSAGVSSLAVALAQRGRGKSCCGKCATKNDGSCRMKGGCGMCGGTNGVMKGGMLLSKPDDIRQAMKQIIEDHNEGLLRAMDLPMQSLISIVYNGLTAMPFEYTPEEIVREVSALPNQNASTEALIQRAQRDVTPKGEFFEGMGDQVVMDRADYLAEHKRLIGLLEDIRKKVTKESKTQKAEPELKKGGRKTSAFTGIHWGAFTKQWKAYRKHHFPTLREFADYVDKNPKEFRPLTRKRALFYKNLIVGRGSSEDELNAIMNQFESLMRDSETAPPERPVARPVALPIPVAAAPAPAPAPAPSPKLAGKKRKAEDAPTVVAPVALPVGAVATPATLPMPPPAKKGKGGAPAKLPFSKAEYLKKVKAAASAAGYDGRKVQFSDKPAKKFMITDEKGKKHYFGATSYGDFHIWSAIDKAKAEQKRNTFQKSHNAIKGKWREDKYSPNNLSLKILW